MPWGTAAPLRELKSPTDVRTGGKGCSVSGCKDLIKWSTILGRGGVCSDCEFPGGKTWGARAEPGRWVTIHLNWLDSPGAYVAAAHHQTQSTAFPLISRIKDPE